MNKSSLYYLQCMMGQSIEVSILAFGIAKDILGSSQIKISLNTSSTVGELKEILKNKYPAFTKLASYRIALNAAYTEDDRIINPNDEIVIIPPVSGG